MDEACTVSIETSLPVYPHLHDLMSGYQLKDLVNVSPEAFKKRIHGFLNLRDYAMEGFEDPTKQEPLSVDFHWGHHHDFGEFAVPGRMCKHHMSMIAVFVDELQVLPRSLEGLRVLDVGCYTGGASLLLCAMGAEVIAIEETRKYAECLDYLRYAFNVEKLEVRHLSLYDCTSPELQDWFDIVLCAGVLHHLSDPKLALRIMFNLLKDGGKCLLETKATAREHLMEFCSAWSKRERGNGHDPAGWNSLLFTPEQLAGMMTDVGYEVIQPCRVIKYKTPEGRLFAVGRRNSHVDMRRAGLSVRRIR